LPGKQQLSNLIVLWDNNGITIDGKVSISDVTDQKARLRPRAGRSVRATAMIP
jgi:transketolase